MSVFISKFPFTKWVLPSMSFLLVLMGLSTTESVPLFSPLVWQIMYTAVAFGLLLFWFRPDKFKLRYTMVALISVGLVRAVSYLLVGDDLYPVAANVLLSLMAYYMYWILSRGLPERWKGNHV